MRKEFKQQQFQNRLRELGVGRGEDSRDINKNRYTLDEIAQEIGVSKSQVSNYLSDKKFSMPSADKLVLLASFFNVTVDYLLGLTDTKSLDVVDQKMSKEFGLSDDAMNKLKSNLEHTDLNLPLNYKKYSETDLINFVIRNFSRYFLSPMIDYFYAYEEYKNFINKHGKENNEGKKSKRILDVENIAPGEEDILIDEAQRLRRELNINRFNLMDTTERFLLMLRHDMLKKEEK